MSQNPQITDFISKTSQIVNKYGKKVIGWDDIKGDITQIQLYNYGT